MQYLKSCWGKWGKRKQFFLPVFFLGMKKPQQSAGLLLLYFLASFLILHLCFRYLALLTVVWRQSQWGRLLQKADMWTELTENLGFGAAFSCDFDGFPLWHQVAFRILLTCHSLYSASDILGFFLSWPCFCQQCFSKFFALQGNGCYLWRFYQHLFACFYLKMALRTCASLKTVYS